MTSVRITAEGVVHALWTDQIDWPALGRVSVQRASHVEFDSRRQLWLVRAAWPIAWHRRWLQRLRGRPMGAILFRAHRREEALAWERAWFGPGGQGWQNDFPSRVADFPRMEWITMSRLHNLLADLFDWLRPPQNVRDHERRQAYGPRWSRHRPRHVQPYIRRRPRRSRRCP